jgi:hypothetical protein
MEHGTEDRILALLGMYHTPGTPMVEYFRREKV